MKSPRAFVLLSILLLLFAGILCINGMMERDSKYIEVIENTASENRGAVSKAYRESWGIDQWSISAFLCLGGAVISAIAAFKQFKNTATKTKPIFPNGLK
ncbi:MAG: hypothetical protein JST85_16900 [Acidobacteria bacterium]|nr:hypothetical protein [Acidobacteriota bacterium]